MLSFRILSRRNLAFSYASMRAVIPISDSPGLLGSRREFNKYLSRLNLETESEDSNPIKSLKAESKYGSLGRMISHVSQWSEHPVVTISQKLSSSFTHLN